MKAFHSILALLIACCLLRPTLTAAAARRHNAFRSAALAITSGATAIDTLSIVPHSLVLRDEQGRLIPDSLFYVDYPNALLVGNLQGRTVHAAYRVFPVLFTKAYFNKEHEKYLSGDTIFSAYNPFFVPLGSLYRNEKLLDNSGLEHNGSLMRGVSVSTSSSASLTSELSLQLSGKLTDELSMMAAVSDKNLPLSPEGNTAALQEFDKVFISVFTDNTSLSAGDVELSEERDFFGKYNRKALGATFRTQQKKWGGVYRTSVSAGVSKGKFARKTLEAIDGNQGAYLLSGAEGERSIVVLSGSERVYADGLLLERGSDADYTISYATAEITFMPRYPVTRNSRIVVEFEYSERSYARYIADVKNSFAAQAGTFYLNTFYEGDAKNQPIDETLTDAERLQMANAGAQLWRAVAPAVDSVAYSGNEILYRKKDTIANGAPLQIYEYSTNPSEAFFRLRFSEVEAGKGSYAPVPSAANGRVYAWVGAGNGSYEPVQALVTPKRKILLTAGGALGADTSGAVALNAALSGSSANLFAANPSVDKTGFAVNLKGDKTWSVGAQSHVVATATALLFDKNFEAPERFVSAEYERDWNMEGELTGRNFQQYSGLLGYRYADKLRFSASLTMVNAGATDAALSPLDSSFSAMQGGMLRADLRLRQRRFTGAANASVLRTLQSHRSTQFVRAKGEVAQGFWRLTAGVRGELEHNSIIVNQTLQPSGKAFHTEEIFLRSDSGRHAATIFARNRVDFIPRQTEMKPFTQAQEAGLASELNGKILRSKFTGTFRHVRYADSAATENLLLGREELSGTFIKGFINTSALYELGAGMEPKQDFIYVEIGTGQGIYAWRDYNSNGVKELNEFEVAAFRDEASYIRVALPSREYVQTYAGRFSFQLSLLPAMLWQQRSGVQGVLSRFSNMFSFSNAHKSLRSDFAQNANPFYSEPLSDSAVVNQSYTALNTLTYLTPGARTKLELTWQGSRAKYMLVNGFELRQSSAVGLSAAQRLTDMLLLTAGAQREEKTYGAQYAQAGAGYDILQRSLSAAGELTPLMHLRVNISYKLSVKKNRASAEDAQLHDALAEITCNLPKKGMVAGGLGFIAAAFTGDGNSAVAYEMLQGYSAGRNFTWSATLRRMLGRGLELSCLYSGRRLPTGRVVHSGNMEVRLLF
ncbi:MAG: hypothetical protein LBT94_05720 [Prevotellaceae bacterium]|nr:hypothetical protein [Prevotellaceae bacterium]